MSRYDGSDTYTYPHSEVLQNKAGLHEQADLDAFEADATAVRLLQLIERPISGEFDLSHLFREGNGRVQRAFCSQLSEQAGYFIDFDEVSREEMYHAMITSFLGDNTPLIALLDRICSVIE